MYARIVIGARLDSLPVSLARLLDLGLRLGAPGPGRALDALSRLQILVDLEEVLDLQPVELRQMVDVTQVFLARILRGYAENLVVAALFVRHPEHTDGAAPDQAAGERRLLEQHEGVERVAVVAEGAFDEAVVGRVLGRGEKGTVQPDPPGLVIHLVLVALSL